MANWSNGIPVTADDFVFSFRRLQDPKTGAKYANMLYVIKNAEKVNTRAASSRTLGVKAVDDKTLEITLEAPTPYFLETADPPVDLPVSKAASREDSARTSSSRETWSPTAPTRWLNSFRTTTSSWSRTPSSTTPHNVKIDTVNYIPTEDRSTAHEALRGRRARQPTTISRPTRLPT